MEDSEIDYVVKKTVRQMINEQWDMIPGVIPESVSQSIRENVRSTMRTQFNIPFGSDYIGITVQIIPNGTIDLEILDTTNWSVWRGILRPPSHGRVSNE